MKIIRKIYIPVLCILFIFSMCNRTKKSTKHETLSKEELITTLDNDDVNVDANVENTSITEETKEDTFNENSSFYIITYQNEKQIAIENITIEDTLQETSCFLIRNDYKNDIEYHYYFRSIEEAVDWIKTRGDTKEGYIVPEGVLNYEHHLYVFYEKGDWKVETVGNSNKISLNDMLNEIPFPKEEKNETDKDNHTSSNSCTFEEFFYEYGEDFDDEFEAERHYEEWGCIGW